MRMWTISVHIISNYVFKSLNVIFFWKLLSYDYSCRDSFDFWHFYHQLYCKMAIIILWAETLLGNYISCADIGVVKLNYFDLLFFFFLIWWRIFGNFTSENGGPGKKNGLLAWVTFCVTLSAMIMHRSWICASFVQKQVGKRARWDQKVCLFVSI